MQEAVGDPLGAAGDLKHLPEDRAEADDQRQEAERPAHTGLDRVAEGVQRRAGHNADAEGGQCQCESGGGA